MSRLSFCIGLARCGKSTYANRWNSEGTNRVVLAGDDFRFAVYNQRFQIEGEELVRASLITAARALYRAGYNILIDDTNTSPASIRHILNIDSNATAIIFQTPMEVCVARAIEHSQFDLPPSIKRMAKNLEVTLEQIKSKEIPIKNVEYYAKSY